jgi:hypothetical protein
MRSTLPYSLKAAATASLVASVVLIGVPFVFPRVPTGPFVAVNWCLFMLASYFALPLRPLGSFSLMDRDRLRVWLIVFLAFTIAGWVALLNGGLVI